MSTMEPDEGAQSDEQADAPRWDEVQEPRAEDAPRWDEVQEAGSDARGHGRTRTPAPTPSAHRRHAPQPR